MHIGKTVCGMSKRIGKVLFVTAAVFAVGLLYSCAGQDRPVWEQAAVESSEIGADASGAAKGIVGSKAEVSDGTKESEQKETGAVGNADVSGPASEERTVTVHICGEVNQPGVYEVPEGSRYYEVLALAGGVTGKGAGDYLNLATVVRDGEKIVVPSLSEAGTDPFGSGQDFIRGKEESAASGQSAGGHVNINTADAELLQTLPGIGQAKAAALIRYRETNGNFKTTEEIMKVPGIKNAAYEQIRDLITVEQE